MHRNYKAAVTLVLALGVLCCLVTVTSAQGLATNYVEGEAIVTFKPAIGVSKATPSLRSHRLGFKQHFRAISQKRGREYGLVRGTNLTTAAVIAELQQDPTVETAEPNYIRTVNGVVPANDPYVPQMWGLQNSGQVVNDASGTAGADIKFNAAWGLAQPATNPLVVAIIDTGVDYHHPDLVSNVWSNPGEIPGNGVDDDGNGFIDDVHGWNFAGGSSDPTDSGYHGTHVAGTVAASGNNFQGVIGVDFQARIMALRASNDGNGLPDSAIIAAIDYAILMKGRGVNVVAINASFGGAGFNSVEKAAVQSAGDAGIVFCAAAGNNGANNNTTPIYPASFRLTNMLVVAATDQADDLAVFSNFGSTTVDLAAPGESILSTCPPTISSPTNFLLSLVLQGGGILPANGLTYATTNNGVTGMVYDCGIGNPGEFPGAVSGNIALIQRGTLTFSNKVFNAKVAGAKAAIIYNNVSGGFFGTLGSPGNWIPAVGVSQSDGFVLKAQAPTTGTVVHSGSYRFLDGTSMACPHVAGAVAFAAMNFPSDTVTQRVARIKASVDVLPWLSGLVVTSGRLNLYRLVDADTNSLPDWWEQAYFHQLTGTNINADTDADGASNLAEWLADTDPTNTLSSLRVVAVTNDTSNVGVTWNSSANRSYYLQRTPDVVDGFLETIATNLPGQAGTVTYVDPSAGTNAALFYRVGVTP